MNTFTKWALAGLAAGTIIGTADAATLALGAREMFFDGHELARTAAATIGLVGGAGLFAALLFAPVHWSFSRWTQSQQPLQRPGVRWSLFTLVGIALLYPAIWQLTSGPQASQIPGRPLWVLGASVVFAVGSAGLTVAAPRFVADSPRRAIAVLCTATAGAILLHLIDLKVLVRLYPVFHGGLSLISLALLTAALFLTLRSPRHAIFQKALMLLVPVGMLTGFGCAAFFATEHNARFVAAERTATASEILVATRQLRTSFAKRDEVQTTRTHSTAHPESQTEAIGPAFTRPGANVVLLSIDAMRFDRLALGGAKRTVAPNLDALAERSVVFTRAYTPAPHTSYALSSLMTGKYTRPLFDVPGAPAAHETWAEILHRFRYDSAAFFTRAIFFIDKPKFKHYWDTSYGFNYRKVSYEATAAQRVDQLIEYLDHRQDDPRPYFAWAHFFEPHEPYDPTCLAFGDTLADRYDCEINSVDNALKKLLAHLEAQSPNTIVIVLADHGEEFLEHGGNYHGTTLYDEQVRVPLMFKIPGIEPRTVAAPVNLVDVLGTVLSVLDLPVPARVRSRDLTHLMLGISQQTTAFAEAHGQSMALADDHKLICTTGEDSCRLYDLQTDPRELKNLAGRKPALERTLRSSLETWHSSHANYELRPVATENGNGAWPKAIRLALTGRLDNLDELVDLVGSHLSIEVRHKAAELLYRLNLPDDLLNSALQAAADDPVTQAWILSAGVQHEQPGDWSQLAVLQNELSKGSNIWRRCALSRLATGDKRAVALVTDTVVSKDTPLDERLEGIALLEKHGDNKSAAQLLDLMNDYQVTLETARVFRALHYQPAIDPMLTRLARERFPERRAAFIEALRGFDAPRVHRGIVVELAREEPPPGILQTLHEMNLTGGRRARSFTLEDGRQVVLSPRTTVEVSGTLERIGVLRANTATKETLSVLCGDRLVARPQFAAGSKVAFVSLEGLQPCESSAQQLRIVNEAGATASGIQLIAFVSDRAQNAHN